MKANKNQIILVFLTLLLQTFFVKAQEKEIPSQGMRGKYEGKSVGWNPAKLTSDGSNASNGVEFYSQQIVCNSKNVRLIKLINKNKYAVKVSYRVTTEGPLTSVTVPASSDIEGICSATDENLAKLIISSNEVKRTSKENADDFAFSEIIVTQIQ